MMNYAVKSMLAVILMVSGVFVCLLCLIPILISGILKTVLGANRWVGNRLADYLSWVESKINPEGW